MKDAKFMTAVEKKQVLRSWERFLISGLLVVSAFLVHAAGTWAYIFFIMLREGEIVLYEPMRPVQMAEFGMAVVWTLVGIFFFVVAILRLKRKDDRGGKE